VAFEKFDLPLRRGVPRPGASDKSGLSYADRYDVDPEGTADVLLRHVPNAVMATAERRGREDGITAQEWIRRVLVQIERDGRVA
jgi:hypothetical protein